MNDKLNAVIEKIRKLHALSASTTSLSESETCLATAARLMSDYQLSEAEIEAKGGETDDPVDVDGEHFLYESGRIQRWKYRLAHDVAKLFNLYSYNHYTYPKDRKTTHIRILGKKSGIMLASYTYEVVAFEIARWADIEVPSRGKRGVSPERESYCLGCVYGYLEKMNAQKKNAMSGASSQALSLIDGAAERIKDEFVTKTGTELTAVKYRPKGNLDGDLFARGLERGKNINVNPSINGTNTPNKLHQ